MAGQPEPDFAVRSRTATSHPGEGGHSASNARDARATRARDHTAKVIPITRIMPGAPSSVPGEAERDLPRPRFRSPLTEDHPSARCVLLHHRERAAAYGDGAWLVAAGYWLATLPVLAVNQAAAAVHFLTENTGRGWFVITLSAVVIILIAVH